ncbi:hypothetical protein BB560_005970 [Smittium megazygosporum]|uniref:DH domain-containing protein n=1 Tax=Smittium megazygosporum TaxID=133381 RepID=A0A2T9YNM6_9FUNG|nr:hypothetical protein BB560_005970 [Smittium megazygosporum]
MSLGFRKKNSKAESKHQTPFNSDSINSSFSKIQENKAYTEKNLLQKLALNNLFRSSNKKSSPRKHSQDAPSPVDPPASPPSIIVSPETQLPAMSPSFPPKKSYPISENAYSSPLSLDFRSLSSSISFSSDSTFLPLSDPSKPIRPLSPPSISFDSISQDIFHSHTDLSSKKPKSMDNSNFSLLRDLSPNSPPSDKSSASLSLPLQTHPSHTKDSIETTSIVKSPSDPSSSTQSRLDSPLQPSSPTFNLKRTASLKLSRTITRKPSIPRNMSSSNISASFAADKSASSKIKPSFSASELSSQFHSLDSPKSASSASSGKPAASTLNRSITIQQISSSDSNKDSGLIMVKNSAGVLHTLKANSPNYLESFTSQVTLTDKSSSAPAPDACHVSSKPPSDTPNLEEDSGCYETLNHNTLQTPALSENPNNSYSHSDSSNSDRVLSEPFKKLKISDNDYSPPPETPSYLNKSSSYPHTPRDSSDFSLQQSQNPDSTKKTVQTGTSSSNSSISARNKSSSNHKPSIQKTSKAMLIHSAQELMHTEKSFAENLYTIKKYWMEPVFASANAEKPIIPYQAARIIFFQFDELHTHALTFYTDLKNELTRSLSSSSDEQQNLRNLRIGALFKSQNRVWQLFVSYVQNYSNSMHLINQLTDYKPFLKYEESLILSKKTARQSLKDLLMLPIQRVMRYSLLLKTILKHTPIDYPDHIELCRAVKTVTHLAVVVNDARRRQEQSQYTLDVIRIIENCPSLPMSPFNKFHFDFVVKELVSRLVTRIFVFSDYMVVSKLSPNSKLAANSNPSSFTSSVLSNNQSLNTSSALKNYSLSSYSSTTQSSNSLYSSSTLGSNSSYTTSNPLADAKESWVFYSYAPLNQIELQNADEHADTLVTVLALNRYKPPKNVHRRSRSVTNLVGPKNTMKLSSESHVQTSTFSKTQNVSKYNTQGHRHSCSKNSDPERGFSDSKNSFEFTQNEASSADNNPIALADQKNKFGTSDSSHGVFKSSQTFPIDTADSLSNSKNQSKSSSGIRPRENSYGSASNCPHNSSSFYNNSLQLGSTNIAVELMQSFIPPPPLRTHVVVLQHEDSESRRSFVKKLKEFQKEFSEREVKNKDFDDYMGLSSQVANGFSNQRFLKEKLRKQTLFNSHLENQEASCSSDEYYESYESSASSNNDNSSNENSSDSDGNRPTHSSSIST